ncbi:ABC transporter permease [Candidatus Latescibacterota bacterium]
MIADIRTVMWKEFKEIFNMRGSKIASVFAMIVPAFLFGVIFPMQFAEQWTESPLSLIVWIIVPFILISALIADSFAGERERHTLETLLSSRLSEKSILLGKICAVMVYALTITAAIFIVGLITVNAANPGGGLLLFSPKIVLAGVLTGLVTASFSANFGVLVSLRAATVRQAQQTLGLAMFVLFFSPSLIIQFVPESYLDRLEDLFRAFDMNVTIGAVVIVLLAADAVLFLWALARFRRDKMLFD